MKVCIVHDTQYGNGEKLAEAMRDRFEASGAEVMVKHENELVPEEALRSEPDLVVVGGAVRAFMVSRRPKSWIDGLQRALRAARRSRDADVYGAVFMTHGLSKGAVEKRGLRLQRRLARALGQERVYPVWISGKVIGQEGPFHDGVLDEVARETDRIVEWYEKARA
ncbi:MAG: hypothetical protein ACOC2Y_04195 [Spirochaetota bacterium]